jgi:acyl-CoA reductase-like NAD-dependent aldehyde dehydrogenase
VEWRVRQLEGLLRMFRENEALLCEALHKDLRKPKHEALSTEVDFLKNDVIGALRHVREWATPTPADKTVQSLLDTTLQHPEPYGVVLVMGAWNYPLQLPMAPVTGAIAAGNCVLIKPSEISPHTAKVIEQLVPKYVDQECIKVNTFAYVQ